MPRDDLIQRPINHLQKGARAPVFQFVGQAGETISSADLLPQGPVVITFYRGAWCSCCQADLRDFATSMPELRKAGASVLGVFHELGPEANAQATEEYHLEFPLVNDPQGHAAEAFGIRRTAKEIAALEQEFGPELLVLKESQPWILPMQARFVIAPSGVIAQCDVVLDYYERSSAKDVIAAITDQDW